MADFSKLKELLTGIPSDPESAAKVKAENESSIEGMKDASSGKDDKDLSDKGLAEREHLKKLVEEAGQNVAGMMGGIKTVGQVPAELAESAAGKLVQNIQNKLSAGQDLSAAEAMLLKKVRPGVSGTITTAAEPVRSVSVNDKFGNLQKMLQDPAPVAPRRLNLPETSGPVDMPQRSGIRKLTGGY